MLPIVLFVQYTRPQAYPPLEHASRCLADAGFRVVFFGTEGAGSSRELQSAPHERIEHRLLAHLPGGARQKAQYLAFIAWVLGYAALRRPTVIYCSDFMSTAPGFLCSVLLGLPVIYHEHDSPAPASSWTTRVLHSTRRALAKRALVCVVPNETRRQRLEATLEPSRTLLVWNCPSRHVPPLRGHGHGDGAGRFLLWYHGSIVPTQLPLEVVDALALLPEHVELRFVGYETVGQRGYVGKLLARAAELRIAHRVRYLGTLPSRAEMYEQASRCHLGLTLFARAFREPMVGASNKPWEYLACGLPVLAGDDDEWRKWVLGEQIGEICDPGDPASIAAGVRRVMTLPDRGASLGRRGRNRIADDWNYQAQFAPVMALVEGLRSSR